MVQHPLEEVLFELRQVGGYVRVTAIDPITATEVVYIGSSRMTQDILKFNARRKLYFVLNGHPEHQGQSKPSPAHQKRPHHMNLPQEAQNTAVPQIGDGELEHSEAHHWLQERGMKPIRAPRRHSFTPYSKPTRP